ncbi:MAG: SprT family zinc-dependent metalloprotease [Rhodospirillales bacterium]
MSLTGPYEHLPLANGDIAPVHIRVDGRAKRISLKVEKIGGLVTLTAPSEAKLPEARRFMSKRTRWIAERRAEAHEITPFALGSAVPFLGRMRKIVQDKSANDPLIVFGDQILIAGPGSSVKSSVYRFFKAEALRRLVESTSKYAAKSDVTVKRVSIRDAKTRWGSCSADGRLSFSWRLVMAPEHVLDYVAAHEVAHLKHMNHSPEYWTHLAGLFPEFKSSERWLKENGPSLRSYG